MILAALAVSGCASATPVAPAPTSVPVAATAAGAATVAPTAMATLEPTTVPQPMAAPATADAPTAAALPDPATVTATTPEQQLAALFSRFTAAPTAQGEALLLTGRVLDVNGNPVPGAAVEIWHTDAEGIYDHPGDRSTNERDRGFQFYGTSITGADGVYAFRTIKPGQYEPRPRHIHVKVKRDGAEILTTQFYFPEDRDTLAQEGVFSQSGNLGDLLILKPLATLDGVSVLSNDLVIDTGIGNGSRTRTPAQTEGPYYPRANVADFDNDLAVVP
jgi:protocatechuate 3,4-dioxygenase beta subunit